MTLKISKLEGNECFETLTSFYCICLFFPTGDSTKAYNIEYELEELDPKKYGVIVRSRGKSGLYY